MIPDVAVVHTLPHASPHGLCFSQAQRRAAAPTGFPTDACTVRPAGLRPGAGCRPSQMSAGAEPEMANQAGQGTAAYASAADATAIRQALAVAFGSE